MQVLITGGAKNGKSKFGEGICTQIATGPMCYIATMYRNPHDLEIAERIRRHRNMRHSKGFTTLEKYTCLKELVVKEYNTALLECIPNLLANEMFMAQSDAINEIKEGILGIRGSVDNLVIITNEVFQDGLPYSKETAEYINILGKLNSWLSASSERVYEVVCGIPIPLK